MRKKRRIIFMCVIVLFFVNVIPTLACWSAVEEFEVFSEDGTRVFVFTPDTYAIDNAYAAVYKVYGNERRLVHIVEDLSSFAYENNFYFSSDMNHFVRMFNESGLAIFEVFSKGTRTRTVLRRDIIENYDSIESITSVGPSYTVRWRIDYFSPHDAIITISTDEGNTFFFDFVNAEFTTESDMLNRQETSLDFRIETTIESTPELHQTTISHILMYILLTFVVIGYLIIVLLKRRKEDL